MYVCVCLSRGREFDHYEAEVAADEKHDCVCMYESYVCNFVFMMGMERLRYVCVWPFMMSMYVYMYGQLDEDQLSAILGIYTYICHIYTYIYIYMHAYVYIHTYIRAGTTQAKVYKIAGQFDEDQLSAILGHHRSRINALRKRFEDVNISVRCMREYMHVHLRQF